MTASRDTSWVRLRRKCQAQEELFRGMALYPFRPASLQGSPIVIAQSLQSAVIEFGIIGHVAIAVRFAETLVSLVEHALRHEELNDGYWLYVAHRAQSVGHWFLGSPDREIAQSLARDFLDAHFRSPDTRLLGHEVAEARALSLLLAWHPPTIAAKPANTAASTTARVPLLKLLSTICRLSDARSISAAIDVYLRASVHPNGPGPTFPDGASPADLALLAELALGVMGSSCSARDTVEHIFRLAFRSGTGLRRPS